MKALLLRILVFMLVFSAGVGSAFVWFRTRDRWSTFFSREIVDHPHGQPGLADGPILAYCELANNPEKYDGKIVRVSARLVQNMHGMKFMNPNCDSAGRETAVEFLDDRADQLAEKIARETDSEKFVYWGMPELIAVGIFHRATPSRRSDSVWDNSELHFSVVAVESAAN